MAQFLALAFALVLQGLQVPAPTGYVNDFAGVIPAEQRARMERLTEAVRAASGGDIAVVTLQSLEGRDVGQTALEIGREWGVGARGGPGDRARNAGTVILIGIEDRAVSVQVGQGAEGFLNDARAGDIRREATPLLREGRYGDALELMTGRVAQAYAAEFDFSLDSALVAPAARREVEGGRGFNAAPIVLLLIFVAFSMARGRRGRRGGIYPIILPPFGGGGGFGGGGFGGGGFGGGGGGFGGFGGGGGFSGGGSSGGW